MPEGGEIEISARSISGDKTEIIIANTGERIPEKDLKRIFQPFYTTKHQGTGLGLWIVSKEIEKSKGMIEAMNSDRTQMRIVLPGKEIEDESNSND
jgi:signal transduction histidine kinase